MHTCGTAVTVTVTGATTGGAASMHHQHIANAAFMAAAEDKHDSTTAYGSDAWMADSNGR